MSRGQEAFVILGIALLSSKLFSWSMDASHTPLHDWIIPAIGADNVIFLRLAFVALVAVTAHFAIEYFDEPERRSTPTESDRP